MSTTTPAIPTHATDLAVTICDAKPALTAPAPLGSHQYQPSRMRGPVLLNPTQLSITSDTIPGFLGSNSGPPPPPRVLPAWRGTGGRWARRAARAVPLQPRARVRPSQRTSTGQLNTDNMSREHSRGNVPEHAGGEGGSVRMRGKGRVAAVGGWKRGGGGGGGTPCNCRQKEDLRGGGG
eukprot:COSAG01_NODE_2701_length_7231_cov_94.005188_1_plen_179_part_00